MTDRLAEKRIRHAFKRLHDLNRRHMKNKLDGKLVEEKRKNTPPLTKQQLIDGYRNGLSMAKMIAIQNRKSDTRPERKLEEREKQRTNTRSRYQERQRTHERGARTL